MSSRERIEVGGQTRLGKFLFCFLLEKVRSEIKIASEPLCPD